ncbi:CHASE2 domain-containing protein [Poseidonibacter lekithochrous]|uniref:CHASE2 domain-containing protein n=1 Tax=Poseidonibacter lekithochrous TaxID=1904463 RepID=UPI0008FC8B7A|nr:adenylate/guanylate cyclase domain-containing protein [Poseidonibacter lekithochrous]QKJ23586.1 CHASE2 sensor-containing adenylate/guanylate cyclase [Poseidonibacter lekithochrous]
MSKKLKKLLIYIMATLGVAIFLSTLYRNPSPLLDSFDNRLRDYLFQIRGEIPTSDSVIIVDIDEKSIKSLGQWPWSRDKVAKVLENLTNSGVAIIGFDIVFAEEDNSSPHSILKKYNIERENIPNYDEIFANTVANTPTILGYVFELEDKPHIAKTEPNIPGSISGKFNDFSINAYGTILNTPQIQENGYSSGFFNNIPDNSGIIRSVPLIISYNKDTYTSLSLEIMRLITQTESIYVDANEEDGIQNIILNDITIPTDRHGRIMVNFRGGSKTFEYYSALDIYNNEIPIEKLQDKIVLIGTSAIGLLDLRAISFDSVYPGVEVHANVIDNIIQGDFISRDVFLDIFEEYAIYILSFLIVFLIKYTPFWMNPVISLVFFAILMITAYWCLFDLGIIINIIFPLLTILLCTIIATLLDFFYEIKQEEAIKKKFAAKVSPEVMNNLLKNIDNNDFQAMEKEVTVFFSDVRGFTNISEQMATAKDLIEYLNEYMEPMSNIITKYEGTIDKYIGDAIMAYWNAPADVQNHADKAVKASLEQIGHLIELNDYLSKNKKPLIDIGIGLNTGPAVVGEMGSTGRSDYTVIGDAINLGARLESLCKYYNSKLNISNFTKEKLEEEYNFRFLDLVTVKGKKEAIEIWQVISQGELSSEIKEELEIYNKAISLYKNSDFVEALELFKIGEENEKRSNKRINSIYIERCEYYIQNPPIDFNGVYEHQTKG